MRPTQWDYALSPILAALLLGAAYGAFSLVGFFGIGLLGLVVGFIAVRVDLERDGATAGDHTVLAEQFRRREAMSHADRAALQAERQAAIGPLFVAKVVAAGLVIFGFGLHFLS